MIKIVCPFMIEEPRLIEMHQYLDKVTVAFVGLRIQVLVVAVAIRMIKRICELITLGDTKTLWDFAQTFLCDAFHRK